MRILLVQTAYLGDIVLTTPLMRELRRAHPRSTLWVLTTETGRQALDGLSCVDRLLVLDKRWGRRGVRSNCGVIRELLRQPFDAAVAAQRSVRTGVLVRLARAKLTVGFSGAPGAWAYDCRIPWDPAKHAVRRYLDLVGPLGGDVSSADPRPGLVVGSAARAAVERLLSSREVDPTAKLLCIAPGSVRATKRWLPRGYAAVVSAAADRGLQPLLIGSAEDRELCRTVARSSGRRVPVLAGETDIPQLVALLARARALVGNDSGPAHVASAVGTPVISIFGSTTPSLGYAAFGPHTKIVEHPHLACRPCSRNGPRTCPLGHFRCMREIEAGHVLLRLDELLAPDCRQHPRRPTLVAVDRRPGGMRSIPGELAQRSSGAAPG